MAAELKVNRLMDKFGVTNRSKLVLSQVPFNGHGSTDEATGRDPVLLSKSYISQAMI
jgi:hypothetical protein